MDRIDKLISEISDEKEREETRKKKNIKTLLKRDHSHSVRKLYVCSLKSIISIINLFIVIIYIYFTKY